MSSPSSIELSTPKVPATADLSAQDRVVGAIERLALSRERLRSTMMPAPPRSGSSASGIGSSDGSFTANLAERLKELPGAAMVIDAVQTWWSQHPLRTATLVAGEASRKFAAPLAERNPMALIVGAVVAGALVAWTRPWRWILRPALFAGLLPAVASRFMRQLPLESWLRMFASVTARSARETAASPSARSTTPSSNPIDGGTARSEFASTGSTTGTPAPATQRQGSSVHAAVP
jgi:hypothetical protein